MRSIIPTRTTTYINTYNILLVCIHSEWRCVLWRNITSTTDGQFFDIAEAWGRFGRRTSLRMDNRGSSYDCDVTMLLLRTIPTVYSIQYIVHSRLTECGFIWFPRVSLTFRRPLLPFSSALSPSVFRLLFARTYAWTSVTCTIYHLPSTIYHLPLLLYNLRSVMPQTSKHIYTYLLCA